jgi:hemerythrin-like metal-binding protein
MCQNLGKQIDLRFETTIKQTMYSLNFHFRYEEELMLNTAFPGFEEHKQVHNAFFKRFLDEVRLYESGRSFIPERFVSFLQDWRNSHYVIDREMGQHLRTKAGA